MFYLSIIFIIFLLLYFFLSLISMFFQYCRHERSEKHRPRVSVIIAAHNEEEKLPACLQSLRELDYPNEKLEFILINDRSTDSTEKLMKEFSLKEKNAKIITINRIDPQTQGKVNSLIQGVRASSGDFLFFTDADCIAPPKWIKSHINGYEKNIGMVGGYLVLDDPNNNQSLFSKVQSIDWIYLTSIAMSWCNMGHPLSIFGNNFSIRKDVYESIGGYEAVNNHIIEDFALCRNLFKKGTHRIHITMDSDGAVYTHPVKNLKEFMIQRKRWAIGCRYHGPVAYLLMSVLFFSHMLTLLFLISGNLLMAALGVVVMVTSDMAVLWHPLNSLKRGYLLKLIPIFKLYQICYTTLMAPYMFFATRVEWKDSEYLYKSYNCMFL